MGYSSMSFDTWIHILEFILVAGIFGVSIWVVKKSKAGQSERLKKRSEEKNEKL